MNRLCRCCGSRLPKKALLIYQNMPKAAQYFPERENLQQEKGIDLALYQCPMCGLVQLMEEPVPYYREVIRATSVSNEMKAFRLKQYGDFVRRFDLAGKKILEVGAGSGEYMEIMEHTGAEVYGLEYSNLSVHTAVRHGHKMIQGFLNTSEDKIEGMPFQAFYIMNFLEHIPVPDVFLQGIYHNLDEDAVGLIEVPNLNMILEKMLFSEVILDHLMYFTKNSLKILLEKNGFEVLECNEIWYRYILSAVVKKRKLIDITGFNHQKKVITEDVQNFIEEQRKKGNKVAAWGAGHQALAIFALAELADNIECVIDSAPFKQGKFTPATHIPVVSPEILKEGKIGAVLITAAGFSDEIAGIMKESYKKIEIGILRDYGVEVITC